MGFSYSNSCDLFGPNFCDVMKGYCSSPNNKNTTDGDLDNYIIDLLDKEVENYFRQKSII